MYNSGYGTFEEMKEKILYKRVVEWNKNSITLDDGTKLSIECSEQDCCASAGGEFVNVKLDAVITDVIKGEKITKPYYENDDEDEEITNWVQIKLFHNQNPIAIAEMFADNGNGGYYYSVSSIVIDNIHYNMVNA